MKNAFGYAALFLWAASMMVGLLFYGQQQLSAFDPLLTLQTAASDRLFDERLDAALAEAGIVGAALVHFETSSPCYCNQLTEPHYQVLSQRLTPLGYQQVRLNIDEHPALAAMIPSTPALAVVDAARQLRYLGPYALGYGCFTGRTLVGRIESLSKAEHPLGTAVMADAQGCFCQVTAQAMD